VGLRGRSHAADGCYHLPSLFVGGPGDSRLNWANFRRRCHGEVGPGEALQLGPARREGTSSFLGVAGGSWIGWCWRSFTGGNLLRLTGGAPCLVDTVWTKMCGAITLRGSVLVLVGFDEWVGGLSYARKLVG
jgi:hypothetical protein